ncbi:2-amino-4-hydroxy-6-hydroxymethyldihydropteridine diphosphokinase [Motiliproteus sp. SC1-56]|uniref:2-amino-4-hydroxy-6- hydroxymethyldihydropteridine diphosphokinase n=1 Tax=Motiliproteus sp. SC1-56 TaxID=2799565 RepID=UPI001A8C5A89|nr:2-amino-4-hydroxy-6-hydroxymethyldihydropteridine diphosphokinase [Motiliproteus sp. SC1-56]
MAEVRAYIGLGSNLLNPLMQVSQAQQALASLAGCREVTHSQLYRSDPVGPPGQPDYINAVTRLETHLAPEALLDRLQAIEQAHNRVRGERWGPRTLDLDLLLYGDCVIDTPRLKVPHPHMGERSFVLYPLAELAPNLVLPNGSPLQALLARCPMGTLQRLGV